MDAAAPEIGQLRWRCRRGMKELDILLLRYLDTRFPHAPADEQQAFRALLEAQDPSLYAYCLGQEAPPAALADVVRRLTATSPAV